METIIQIYNNEMFGLLRVAEADGKVYFNLSDACKALSIGNARNVKSRLEESGVHSIDTPTFNQHVKTRNDSLPVNGTTPVLINESGLYSLNLSSKLHQSKGFLWRKGCQVSWVSGVKVIFHVLHSPQFARHNSLVSLWGRNKGRNLEFNGQEIVRMGLNFSKEHRNIERYVVE